MSTIKINLVDNNDNIIEVINLPIDFLKKAVKKYKNPYEAQRKYYYKNKELIAQKQKEKNYYKKDLSDIELWY